MKQIKTTNRVCKLCGIEFTATGKQIYCTVCKESRQKAIRDSYRYTPTPIHSNVDKAISINGIIATIKCECCNNIFIHDCRFIDRKTVIPTYCEHHRNEYKREFHHGFKDASDSVISIDYEKIIEYHELFGVDMIYAVYNFHGTTNDIDLYVMDKLYSYILKTRGRKYFK